MPDSFRSKIYDHIFKSFGKEKCAYVLALGTISDKGTIDDVGRALAIQWEKANPQAPKNENPYSLDAVARIKKEYDEDPEQCRQNYPDLFYYFDGMKGAVVSLSHHPAGVIIAPLDLYQRYGVMRDKDNLPVLMLDMDASHGVGLAKYDILGLDTVQIIKSTCDLAGLPYPHTWEIDFNDPKVWADMKTSPYGLFQFVEDFAFESLKKFDVHSIQDLSLVTAAIRPGGASYRDQLFQHEVNHNPSREIDDLLADSLGWLVFQEQTIAFLQKICGMSGGDADSVRRAIGHKDEKAVQAAMPQILNGYCEHSSKPRAEAEKEASAFLQIIKDSSSYQFGLNHATGYSILTYYCAYYRYYYPVEFVTALLNTADNQKKILAGTMLAAQRGIQIKPIRFRHSLDQYTPDVPNKTIYKGMASIKYLNKKIGRELYALRDKQYDSFVDLLVDIDKTSMNSRQLTILIELDFFSEFGNPDQLKAINEIYEKYKNVHQMKKQDLPIPESHLVCESVTEKMYKGVSARSIIDYLVAHETADIKTGIKTIVQYEFNNLGYVQYVNPSLATSYYYVLSIDGKYKNKHVTLYQLCSGNSFTVKVRSSTLEQRPIGPGNIIKSFGFSRQGKWSKTADGQWVQSTEQFDDFLIKYSVVR